MTRSERAMQVWQILVGVAHNRQTLTYGQVAEHLEPNLITQAPKSR
jgi:hypothetical protein